MILPRANENDTKEIPDYIRNEMTFIFADRVEDVLAEMLPALAEKFAMVA